jgi:antitoxin component YwqK of YwqJK toxin-antitoxin module
MQPIPSRRQITKFTPFLAGLFLVAVIAILLSRPHGKNGKTTRKIEEKYEDGALKVQLDVVEGNDGKFVSHGSVVRYHPNRQKSAEGNYYEGKETGTWIFWNDGGVKVGEGRFENGKLNGKWIEYYPADALKHRSPRKKIEIEWRNGSEDGPISAWHPNGKRACDGEFRTGNKHGIWMFFDEDGKPIRKELYSNGKPVGKWIYWDSKGKAWLEENFSS